MSPSDSPDHSGSILYHLEPSEIPIPQNSNWSGTLFVDSYGKLAPT